MKKIFSVFILLIITQFTTHAQDRVFATTYQSNVIPYGARDLEFWATARNGHKSNFYFGLDNRFEYEIGLGKNVQTSLYFNTDNSVQGDPTLQTDGTTQDIGISVSNEWKWKLSDPVANAIGSALYEEIEVEPDEFESETKIILDKKIGKNLIAFNGVYSYQIGFDAVKGKSVTSWESPVELDFGYMYTGGKHLGLGIEAKIHNDISQANRWENAVLYAGPSLYINGSGWLINFNILPQLTNLYKTTVSPDNLVLNSHERVETRIVLSFSL